MPKVLRIKAVAEKTGLSLTTINRMVAAGTFCVPLTLSPSTKGFLDHEVDAWIERRALDRQPSAVEPREAG